MIISILALVIGFVIDLIVGDPRNIPHPICAIGNLISKTEKFLRNKLPKTQKGERLGGVLLVIFVVTVSFIVPFAIIIFANIISVWLRLVVESIMCWQILATKCLKDESMKVYYPLKKGDVEGGRYAVSMIVGRDTSVLDENGIIKATVETIAENTSDGAVAPMFFCLLGGPSLGFFYKAVNTMDSMVGYKNDKYMYFGRCAAHLDDILNYIPARFSALIMIISSFIVGLNGKNALKIWKRDKRKHASPNSAQTESVCAGALEVQLAGDAVYFGKTKKKEFIGDNIRPINYEDIKKANSLLYATSTISVIIFALVKFFVWWFVC